MMDDKEVGKLWSRAQTYEGKGGPADAIIEAWQDIAEELIRKLVEERKARIMGNYLLQEAKIMRIEEATRLVLSEFGISEEEWTTKK